MTLLEASSLILLVFLLQGASCAIIASPINEVNVTGSSVTLECISNVTASKDDINWFFEQSYSDYTAVIVNGCTSTNTSAYETISNSPGECTLVIKSLEGPFSGRYTCMNGAESPVSALVGVIVNGPKCEVLEPNSIVVGNEVTVSCEAATVMSNTFIMQTKFSTTTNETRSLAQTNSEQKSVPETTDWTELPYFGFQLNSTFVAENPMKYQYIFTMDFKTNVTTVPADGAKNDPLYQYIWKLPTLNVMYPPKGAVINGCIGPIAVGSKLQCVSVANPVPTYTWSSPEGIVGQGEYFTVRDVGTLVNYTCVVSNPHGTAAASCTITSVVASGPRLYWSLTAMVIGLMITAFSNLV